MPTPEAKVRNAVIAYAKRSSVHHIRLHFGFGVKTGWPDDLFLLPGGRPLFIEFKAPGKEPTKKQERKIKLLQRLGYSVHVVDDAADGKHYIDAALLRSK